MSLQKTTKKPTTNKKHSAPAEAEPASEPLIVPKDRLTKAAVSAAERLRNSGLPIKGNIKVEFQINEGGDLVEWGEVPVGKVTIEL